MSSGDNLVVAVLWERQGRGFVESLFGFLAPTYVADE